MTNPLIEKFYELHPEKKEKPKETKAEIEITDTLKKYPSTNTTSLTSVTSNLTNLSVATSTTGIIKASSFITHDIHDTEKTFLQVADKIKQGKAKVSSVSMEHDVMLMGGTKITFEVYVDN
jgi:hypothetical protein